MRKGFIFFFVILGFLIACYSTLFFESEYRTLVVKLYKFSTKNNISFTGKAFNLFPTYKFSVFFGIWIVFFIFRIINFKIKNRFIHFVCSFFLFFITTFLFCYIEGNLKIIECTACDDGKLQINYNQINYDLIFITSLIVSIMPLLITTIKRNKSVNLWQSKIK